MIGRNASALCSWPVACTAKMRSLPYSVPVGRFTFACATACSTSLMPTPRAARGVGVGGTRPARFSFPYPRPRPPPRRGGDRGAHVLRGGVDVPIERELDGDARHALAAHRSHLVDAGDGGEAPLEHRGDRRGHGPEARPAHIHIR